jgi:hypothetical protein
MHIQLYYIIFKYRSATNETHSKGYHASHALKKKTLILCHVTLDTPVTLVTSGKPRRSFLVSFLVLGPGFPVAVRGPLSNLWKLQIVSQRVKTNSGSLSKYSL